MGYARIFSLGGCVLGMQVIEIEVHLVRGLPSFHVVGLPEKAVRESRDRVKSALLNAQFMFPRQKVVVGLAPAELPKEGSHLDLAIAIGLLVASKQVQVRRDLREYIWAGELGLSGQVRPTGSSVSLAMAAQKLNHKLVLASSVLLPQALQKPPYVYGAGTIQEVANFLSARDECELLKLNIRQEEINIEHKQVNLEDIYGNSMEKIAVLAAASGGHSLLLEGCPGVGKTMLAMASVGILPDLNQQSMLDVAQIYSLIGEIRLTKRPPFRAPHHMVTVNGLLGGGQVFQPGELSLAHHGILFLDELTEYKRATLDHLREPLQSGQITISKSNYRKSIAAECILIAAMNPCPCGNYGILDEECLCGYLDIQKYRARLSGPFLDRLDMRLKVTRHSRGHSPKLDWSMFLSSIKTTEIAKVMVKRARDKQMFRQNKLNSVMGLQEILNLKEHEEAVPAWVDQVRGQGAISFRGIGKTVALARTLADCHGHDQITIGHIKLAENMRASIASTQMRL
ncbi:MAG: YifB family Mg chelatase-like AAA ATPase [Pseudomonadota bacterium]|nr:YifB family Mg chelatase-like AAA ATPase [Pseudomonadota bacterium]